VERVNASKLASIPGQPKVYRAVDRGEPTFVNQLKNHCQARETLELKVDAQVMLLKNMNAERGLVNGACGIVIGFTKGEDLDEGEDDGEDQEEFPIVRFASGATQVISWEKWEITMGAATRKQIPLALAYAIR
jgi:hypothetical protein